MMNHCKTPSDHNCKHCQLCNLCDGPTQENAVPTLKYTGELVDRDQALSHLVNVLAAWPMTAGEAMAIAPFHNWRSSWNLGTERAEFVDMTCLGNYLHTTAITEDDWVAVTNPQPDERYAYVVGESPELSKYHRVIATVDHATVPAEATHTEVLVDVYDVLKAFDVTCPATAHAIKKLLAPGQRGHKDFITDIDESIQALHRAKELHNDVY